jgi:hypothetical protein
MKAYISADMQKFLTPKVNEEAVDQPLYHLQAYGTGGATSFTFFNTSAGGLTVTNMDAAQVLSKGKRFVVFSLGVAYIPGQSPVQSGTSTTVDSALKDAKAVLEGAAFLQFSVLDKTYLNETPLIRVPAGIGLFAAAGGIQATQASAADGLRQISYAANGLPVFGNSRKLRVPVPIPEQVRFSVTITYPTPVTVQTAGQLGVWLDGMLLRAVQ